MSANHRLQTSGPRITGLAITWLAISSWGAGCLPSDNRPEPAELLVTAEPSEGTAHGFITADGWAISFDRFVTGIGDVDLDGATGYDDDSCNSYSETHYEWLFDFTVAGREKVGLVHGLGACSVEYRFRAPSDDTVLGPGATKQDVALMMTRATDAYAEDQRVTLVVQGEAERGGIIKRFDWAFRHSYEIERCASPAGEGFVSVLDLEGRAEHTLRIVVRGEELFRTVSASAPPQFDLFAAADADVDGWVTFLELAELAAPPGHAPPEGVDAPLTLADLVYEVLLPRVTHVAGSGACEVELRDR